MPGPATATSFDRCAAERREPGLIATVLADDTTRVLDVAGDRLRVAPAPAGERATRLAWRVPGEADRAPGRSVRPATQMPEAPGAPTRGTGGPGGPEPARPGHVFLGRDDGGTAYVATLHRDVSASRGEEWAGLRGIASWLTGIDAAVAPAAVGLARWHGRNAHCPRCGAPTTVEAAGWVRHCARDGVDHFPRTDPAVMVAVLDPGDRLLLARGPNFPVGWLSVLAGFVEPGETLEETVRREVREETGLGVDDVRYVGSQPWPFPASLMIAFTARATATDLRLDPAELAEARWYTREELAADRAAGSLGVPGRVSIARRLIEDWYGAPLRRPHPPAPRDG